MTEMTHQNGITSAPTIHVRCTTPGCPVPADTRVTLPVIGNGIAGRPQLLCTGCDQTVTEMDD